MDSIQIVVTIVVASLIGLVVWYFFFAPHRVASAVPSSAGVQQVDITVKGGYSPDVIEVERGKPVQLNFYRDEESSCSEELLLPDFQIRRDLSAFRTTACWSCRPSRPVSLSLPAACTCCGADSLLSNHLCMP